MPPIIPAMMPTIGPALPRDLMVAPMFMPQTIAASFADGELRYSGGHADLPPLSPGDYLLHGERLLFGVMDLRKRVHGGNLSNRMVRAY